jgi:hypothetical protein
VPIGRSPKFAGIESGTTDVTGIASRVGKIAKGSVNDTTTVLSFGAVSPAID